MATTQPIGPAIQYLQSGVNTVESDANKGNKYGIKESGNYLLNMKDGGSDPDELFVTGTSGITANLSTDPNDIVHLGQGWTLSNDKDGVKTYTKGDSTVAITGGGVVDLAKQTNDQIGPDPGGPAKPPGNQKP